MSDLQTRWSRIIEDLERHKKNKFARIIAVSKGQSVRDIELAAAAGIRDFGENYVQEAIGKINAIAAPVNWHFVGHLQTNKMKKILPRIQCLHSLCQRSQLDKILTLRPSGLPKFLVQINLSGEDSKAGLSEDQIRPFFDACENHQIAIAGLMTFPPFQEDPEKNRVYFAKLALWSEKIRSWKLSCADSLTELSMGVSSDFKVALEEGATMVRVGEAIFGRRRED